MNDKLHDQDQKTRNTWMTLQKMFEAGTSYSDSDLHEQTKASLVHFFNENKDKEGWENIDDMISNIQAKIQLTGWNWSDAIKFILERNQRRKKSRKVMISLQQNNLISIEDTETLLILRQ